MRTRHPGWRDERGSASIWAVLCTFAMVLLVGLTADLGGRTFAEQEARAVAGQAARAGAQQVRLDETSRGQTAVTDPALAARAAEQYLTAARQSGTATVTSPDTITITITGRYPTQFLSLIGITELPVSGTATATVVRVYQGAPR